MAHFRIFTYGKGRSVLVIYKLKFLKTGTMISIRSMVQGLSSAFLPGLVSAFSLAPCAGALGRSVLKCFDARLEK